MNQLIDISETQADPYCMLRVGAQEQQTKVAQGGGKKPVSC